MCESFDKITIIKTKSATSRCQIGVAIGGTIHIETDSASQEKLLPLERDDLPLRFSP